MDEFRRIFESLNKKIKDRILLWVSKRFGIELTKIKIIDTSEGYKISIGSYYRQNELFESNIKKKIRAG